MDNNNSQIVFTTNDNYGEMLERALEISEELMLYEKAAKGEYVVISFMGSVVKIPAKDIIRNGGLFMKMLKSLPAGETISVQASNADMGEK